MNNVVGIWFKSKYEILKLVLQKAQIPFIIGVMAAIVTLEIKNTRLEAIIERQDTLMAHIVKRQDYLFDRQDKQEELLEANSDALAKMALTQETVSKIAAINFQWNSEQDENYHRLKDKLLDIDNTQDADRKALLYQTTKVATQMDRMNNSIESMVQEFLKQKK